MEAHPIDELLQDWANETDATWETNDQTDFAKTNNKINIPAEDAAEEDAEMAEQETDTLDGEPDPDGASDGEYVEDNMQLECICNKTVTPIIKHTATQTQNQNINQPTEPDRIICRPERQIQKQKTLLAKKVDTIKRLEHSLDIKVSQIDRLQKRRTELKSELNLRWKEVTSLQATTRNLERKLQESEAKLRETSKTNRWRTRTKHILFNLHITPPMTIRLQYRQTLSTEHILVQTSRNDIEDFGKHCNLLNLNIIMGREKIEITVLRVVKNLGTKRPIFGISSNSISVLKRLQRSTFISANLSY